jgi:hypothetical protein
MTKREIKKTELKNFFKEREEFLNSLRDKKLYNTYNCPKHNVFVRVGIDCPLCALEKNKKAVEGSPKNEEKEKEEKRRKDRERKRKEMLDPEKRAKHYEAIKRYREKERKRKAEHSAAYRPIKKDEQNDELSSSS